MLLDADYGIFVSKRLIVLYVQNKQCEGDFSEDQTNFILKRIDDCCEEYKSLFEKNDYITRLYETSSKYLLAFDIDRLLHFRLLTTFLAEQNIMDGRYAMTFLDYEEQPALKQKQEEYTQKLDLLLNDKKNKIELRIKMIHLLRRLFNTGKDYIFALNEGPFSEDGAFNKYKDRCLSELIAKVKRIMDFQAQIAPSVLQP